jgi:hypothetical protein
MIVGGLVAVLGLVITLGTYGAASASEGGGTYLVCWGTIVFGGLQFLRGLLQSRGQ